MISQTLQNITRLWAWQRSKETGVTGRFFVFLFSMYKYLMLCDNPFQMRSVSHSLLFVVAAWWSWGREGPAVSLFFEHSVFCVFSSWCASCQPFVANWWWCWELWTTLPPSLPCWCSSCSSSGPFCIPPDVVWCVVLWLENADKSQCSANSCWWFNSRMLMLTVWFFSLLSSMWKTIHNGHPPENTVFVWPPLQLSTLRFACKLSDTMFILISGLQIYKPLFHTPRKCWSHPFSPSWHSITGWLLNSKFLSVMFLLLLSSVILTSLAYL